MRVKWEKEVLYIDNKAGAFDQQWKYQVEWQTIKLPRTDGLFEWIHFVITQSLPPCVEREYGLNSPATDGFILISFRMATIPAGGLSLRAVIYGSVVFGHDF